MPPKKQQKGKKAVEKEKKAILVDKTFGMKNKKGSKAQKFITNVKKQVDSKFHNAEDARRMKEMEMRKAVKEEKKNRDEMFEKLTNALPSKKNSDSQNGDGSDNESDYDDFFVDEEYLLENGLTLEEYIESERNKILEGTPVTDETFAAWKEKKKREAERKRQREEATQVESFKKTGHGITGRQLFMHDSTLFRDDQDAAENEEMAALQGLEEQLQEMLEGADVDEALFEEGALEEAAPEVLDPETSPFPDSYDPSEWNFPKEPKALLMDYYQKNKIKPNPKFELVRCAGMMQRVKINLVHCKKEFFPEQTYSSKKAAEHNACLAALRFLRDGLE